MTKSNPEKMKVLAREYLGTILGFRDCAPSTLDRLIVDGSLYTLGKGQTMATRGQAFDFLGLIVQGSLETCIINPDGHRHLISFLQPGDVVGVIGMLDGLGHIHDLIARSADTTVLRIPGASVRELRNTDPTLGRAFELQLAYRSRLLHERLASDSGITIQARVARLLLTLFNLYGEQRPGGMTLRVKVSQSDLADWLGVSRQSINAVLQPMNAQGIILLSYSTFILMDKTKLHQLTKL